MKKLILIVSLLILGISTQAQRPEGGPKGDRIKTIKIGMITQELKLTESQAEKFWPIYNAYSDDRNEIFRDIRQLSRNNQSLNNNEALKRQDEILDLRQEEINLTKKYRDSFLKVISPQQYGKLMETERKFNQMLLEKLKERKGREN